MLSKGLWRDYLENILIAVLLAIFIRNFVWTAYRVPTDSMAPTLEAGDFIFAFRLPFGISSPWSEDKLSGNYPHRGDVVVFSYPDMPRVSFVRRVLALPGDFVSADQGRILVNENPTPSVLGSEPPFSAIVIPIGQVFVAQDDLGRGTDSDKAHKWGLVPVQKIEGRVQLIWLSLDWSSKWADGLFPAIRTSRTLRWIPAGDP
jgi:signal peptidase I